jgi:DNA-directed RNA polymerase sigma subunit (sigma70/sigma32)
VEEQRLEAEVESLLGHFAQPEQEILRLKWGLYDALPASLAPMSEKPDATRPKKHHPPSRPPADGRKLTIKQIAACCQSSYNKIQRLESKAAELMREQGTLMGTMGYGAMSPLDLVHQLFTEAQGPNPSHTPIPSFA